MSFQISPGVQVREKDLSLIIPSIPISIGAYVGEFNWGPVNHIRIIDSTETLERVFGRPDDSNARGYFTAYNYLQYSQDLRAVRVIPEDDDIQSGDTIGNAVGGVDDDAGGLTGAAGLLAPNDRLIVRNQDDFIAKLADSNFANISSLSGGTMHFVARFPGDRGNRISVSVVDEDGFTGWTYENQFAAGPSADNNEFALIVLLDGEPVETFILSANPEALDQNGQSMFADFVINNRSEYIYMVPENVYEVVDGDLVLDSTMLAAITASSTDTIDFGFGGNSYQVSASERDAMLVSGWSYFTDAEDMDINFCITGDASAAVAKHVVENVCETRMDCVAFISPPIDTVVGSATPASDIVEWRRDVLNVNSSYAIMDGNYKLQLDPFNRVYRWIPLNGDIAGLAARTSQNRDPWWSPAGLERGQIKNVVRLAFIPSKAKRDELYKNGINIVTAWQGEGNVLWGDKTLLARPSAFDRINVRMLFIVIEKAIAKAARNQLFEFNDEFTRNRFIQAVEPYLRDVQGRRGIIRHQGRDGFVVIADERINTPEVIDRNEFRAKILVKPARSINFITLTFAATRTGVEFEELIEEIFPETT